MLLVKVQVENFRSIDKSGEVAIDPAVTVLVGQNESGKTGFLSALELSYPVRPGPGFTLDRDFPRKAVNDYRKAAAAEPAVATRLTYRLTPAELAAVNKTLGVEYLSTLEFTITHTHKNTRTIALGIKNAEYVKRLLASSGMPDEVIQDCQDVTTVRRLIQALTSRDLDGRSQHFLGELTARFLPTGSEWHNLLDYEIWTKHLADAVPKFFYFDDYYLLPGKVNLPDLASRAATPDDLTEEDRTALNLLNLAGVQPHELTAAEGYEPVKARLEALSNAITDTIFQYWTQDRELEVEFDIRADPADRPPFNVGPNLYVRIRSRRHRVTVPFHQRSKGFIWFFSFVVWFKSIRQQLGESQPLILLFDEPGLNLHALAQKDFLRYMDVLAADHQILYSTHSPFLIPADHLDRVRVVEDRKELGTVVTADLADADPRTLFPLQAALGSAILGDLLPAKRNLLVRGPADLVLLKFFSAALERAGRVGLRDDIAVVPAGGLDRVATFVTLLGAGRPDLVVLHDGTATPELPALKPKQMLSVGLFRDPATKGKPAGVEDLIAVNFYLKAFNAAFAKKLPDELRAADLPPGDRITDRLTAYLAEQDITLRDAGGYDPLTVAGQLASSPPKPMDKETLARFEALFKKVNALLG